MPTLTPPFDHPLHGIIERESDRFVLRTNAATASPFAFCEEGAVASVRSHAEYLRAIADFMEKLAEDPGFDISDWIEMEDDPEPPPDVGINPGTWDWAKLQMKQGKKVTRPVPGVDWYYFMDESGKIMFGVPKDENSDPGEAEISTYDTSSVAWRIYEGKE